MNIGRVPVDEFGIQTHRVLGAPKRAQLLEVLRDSLEPLSVAAAAHAVGLHVNTTRMHLDLLTEVGLAVRVTETPQGPGRPKALYRATPADADDRSGDVDYRALAGVLAAGLATTPDPVAASVAAGRRWTAVLDATDWSSMDMSARSSADVLDDVMGDLGFEPEIDMNNDQIRLHRCPFADVARHHRQVVCNVHLGMVQATLERLGGSLHAVGIEPFVSDDPLLCRVRLASTIRQAPSDKGVRRD